MSDDREEFPYDEPAACILQSDTNFYKSLKTQYEKNQFLLSLPIDRRMALERWWREQNPTRREVRMNDDWGLLKTVIAGIIFFCLVIGPLITMAALMVLGHL